mmetsp:Transcript_38027/g.95269  ORF Transcript_38027/g.95269 Transcript_38027/m.95269 type:complete len:148 (-) Transcript_38027:436-879(-)
MIRNPVCPSVCISTLTRLAACLKESVATDTSQCLSSLSLSLCVCVCVPPIGEREAPTDSLTPAHTPRHGVLFPPVYVSGCVFSGRRVCDERRREKRTREDASQPGVACVYTLIESIHCSIHLPCRVVVTWRAVLGCGVMRRVRRWMD